MTWLNGGGDTASSESSVSSECREKKGSILRGWRKMSREWIEEAQHRGGENRGHRRARDEMEAIWMICGNGVQLLQQFNAAVLIVALKIRAEERGVAVVGLLGRWWWW